MSYTFGDGLFFPDLFIFILLKNKRLICRTFSILHFIFHASLKGTAEF